MHRAVTRLLASTILAASAVAGAFAQESDPLGTTVLGPIVVTPNRVPVEQSKVGSSIAVVEQEEIEQAARPVILDYLDRIPGLHVSSSGGNGQETSLTMRGADKKYIKTLFNGIDIADPTAPQVQTSFEHLLADGVDRIEVLKGSQGTLYGADAVAGVISMSTLSSAPEGLHGRFRAEGGSFGTARASVGVSNVFDGTRFAVNFGGVRSDGISAADRDNGNPERDGWQNISANFALEQQVTDIFSVFAYGLYWDAKTQLDDSGNPPLDNPDNVGDNKTIAGRAGFNLDLLDGRFRNTFSVQGYKVDRSLYTTTFGPFEIDYAGRRLKAEYQGSFEVNDRFTIMAGADYEKRDLLVENIFSTTQAQDSIAGVWTQALLEPIDNLALSAGVRHDEHDRFGGYTTWRGTAAYTLPTWGTTFRSSVGTGFRAPSPYENNYVSFLSPIVPLPDLQPEESFSFDVGIDQRLLDDRLTLSATWFMLDTDNLIDYDSVNDTYIQIPGTTERSGVELSAAWQANSWLTLAAAYTYTRSVQENGDRRPRVPRHVVGLAATAKPWEKWTFSADAKIAMDAVDVVSAGFGATALTPLDDYVLVGGKIAYNPTEDTELYLRAENLFNDNYQVVKGYGAPGFAVYGGFSARF